MLSLSENESIQAERRKPDYHLPTIGDNPVN